MSGPCTGVGCEGCEAARRHYRDTGCLVRDCTDPHTKRSARVGRSCRFATRMGVAFCRDLASAAVSVGELCMSPARIVRRAGRG